MAGNWGAILAGLAGGGSSLADSMIAREQAAVAKAERDRAFKRLTDNDALLAQDRDEDRAARKSAADLASQDRANALREKALSDLTTRYGSAGVKIIDPEVMQVITGSRLMPTITGADSGPEATIQNLTNAVTQGGRGIGAGVQSEALKALAQSTAQQGANVPVSVAGRQIGFAQDPNAAKKAEAQQQHTWRMQEQAAGRVDNTLVAIEGPDGNPVLVPRSQAAGQKPWQKGTLGGGSAQGSQAPLDDMMTRYEEIEAHGKDLANKKFKFTNTNATREALQFGQTYAQSEGKPAIGAQLGQTAMDLFGLAKGSSEDQQRYARLMASTRAFGDDAAKVFKGRQGFQNISYEVAQATLRPEDYGHPEIIAQKLNRMRHVVKLAALVAPNQAKAADPAKLSKFLSDAQTAQTGKPNPEY